MLPDEIPFRIAFGAFWLLSILVRLPYRKPASLMKRRTIVQEAREKRFFQVYMLTFLIMPVYVLTTWADVGAIPFGTSIRWVAGAGLLVAYLFMLSWSHRSLGPNWSGILEVYEGHALIVTGPYRFVRHPMYLSFYLSAFGYFILSANWLISVPYLAALTWMYLGRVSDEEKMMEEAFGEAYRSYAATTGRLLPRSRRHT